MGAENGTKCYQEGMSMKIQTLQKLRQLHKKYAPGPFGKIAQKLLAISFREMGYTHIVERSIEGVDITMTGEDGSKFAVEVKTTDGLSINLSANNLQDLRDRLRDGYSPIIGALRLAIFENWILAKGPLDELSAGEVLIDRLRAYRIRDMENLLCPTFEQVVERHFEGTLKGGQRYLSEQLARTGIEVRDF